MRARRTLAALLVATVLSTVGASVGLGARPAAAATTPTATLVVAPDGGGIVHADRGLGVSVTVTNTGSTSLPAGRITVSVDRAPVPSTSALLTLITKPPEALQGVLLPAATASVPSLAAGTTRTVRLTMTDDDLSAALTRASGARTLYVQYAARPDVQVIRDSAIVRIASGSTASVGLGVVIPVLAPAGSTGVVDIATQQQLTAPDGAWSRALRAAESDPSATVALDPEVLASIRIAGSAAPPEVRDFLDRLGGLPNEFLRLPYADGDVTLERAAGVAPSSLEPTSFAGITLASPDTNGATPAPTATAGTSAAAASDLTDWNWSDRHVTWPVPHTTNSAALAAFGRAGQVLLPSDDLQDDTPARRAAGPLARIGSTRVLVSDATTSSLLATASAGDTAGASALATLTGLLATAAVTGETTGVLATVGRSTDTSQLDQVLRLLQRQSWVRPTSLGDLGSGAEAATVRLRARSVTGATAATARSLVSAERGVEALGKAIVAGADTVTAPQRLALLGVLSSAWRDDPDWATAASAARAAFTEVLGKVRLAKQSPPNLIGSDGTLSVYVANTLATPVRVTVHAGVSNGAVQFTDPSVTLIVPAGGSERAKLAFRSIRNGRTDLTLALTTPAGTPLDSTVIRGANVRAGFDTIVAVALLSALGLLLALGVYRNVKRRRPPRMAAA